MLSLVMCFKQTDCSLQMLRISLREGVTYRKK